MEYSFSFGSWLRQRRKALDLTQAELALQLGCATVTLQKIELDERRPSKEMAERLATVLAIPPDERAAFLQSARGDLAVDRLAGATPPPAAPPPWQPASHPLDNLPVPPTPLIGREQAVTDVIADLRRPEVRLLTLTGPGGIGKTRLAIAAASALLNTFPDGLTFVDLAPITDPTLVLPTIAQTLDIKETGDQPLPARLATVFRARQALLVLDNFEQVLPAAREVATMLATAPGLKVLVTSRAVLRLAGEHEYPVPPLGLPDRQQLPALPALSQFAAVALFLQRAQAVTPAFQLTQANAPAVAEICSRLDGLPLAIELAAARSRLFTPAALLTRLANKLQFLTGGARDLPTRQQTIRNTLTWSYDLLTPAEQRLFQRLGVFVGGWTLAAAEAVCDASGNLGTGVVDGLQALVEQSLVRQAEGVDGEPRFRMLETIREFAFEQLETGDDGGLIRHSHAAYFRALLDAGAPELYYMLGTPERAWLARVAVEYDNLRAALEWAVQQGGAELALHVGTALWQFWVSRGSLDEGRRWLAAALALPPPPATIVRARAAYAAAILAGYQSDTVASLMLLSTSLLLFREAGDKRGTAWALLQRAATPGDGDEELRTDAIYEECLVLFREVGDLEGFYVVLAELIWRARHTGDHVRAADLLGAGEALLGQALDQRVRAMALQMLGHAAAYAGDYARARGRWEESLILHRQSSNQIRLARSLGMIGSLVRDHGDLAWAAALYEEGVSVYRELDHKDGLATMFHGRAEVALLQGDDALVEALEPESRRLYREIGNIIDSAWPLSNLGYAAQHQRDYTRAYQLHAEGLQVMVEANYSWGIGTFLAGLAGTAARQGHAARAARLFGVAEQIHTTLDHSPAYAHQIEIEHNVATARTFIDDAAFAAAWAEGRVMPLEQAIAYALEATAAG